MIKDFFESKMLILSEVFPGYKFPTALMWERLQNLSESDFGDAVDWIVDNIPDLFSSNNIISIIRQKVFEYSSRRQAEKRASNDPREGWSKEEEKLSDEARDKFLGEFRKAFELKKSAQEAEKVRLENEIKKYPIQ